AREIPSASAMKSSLWLMVVLSVTVLAPDSAARHTCGRSALADREAPAPTSRKRGSRNVAVRPCPGWPSAFFARVWLDCSSFVRLSSFACHLPHPDAVSVKVLLGSLNQLLQPLTGWPIAMMEKERHLHFNRRHCRIWVFWSEHRRNSNAVLCHGIRQNGISSSSTPSPAGGKACSASPR